MVLSNSLGLMWIADFENSDDGDPLYLHIIGPAFYDDISPKALNDALAQIKLPVQSKSQLHEILTQLPVIPAVRFLQYGLMLHYTITEEKITVSQLATLVNYAEYYLIKKFKQETGQTISSYIISAKMKYAKLLLTDSSDTIQEIAVRLGYATQSHFGEQFKKTTGMTPGEYKGKATNKHGQK